MEDNSGWPGGHEEFKKESDWEAVVDKTASIILFLSILNSEELKFDSILFSFIINILNVSAIW